MRPALAVIAKEPRPGACKTRLSPPLSPGQAAQLAEAALCDTLASISQVRGVARRVLILDGSPGRWLPGGIEVIAQRGGGLDERLAGAFADLGGAALVIGMDTPQLTAAALERALALLADSDAVLGPADDGGYWGIGLANPCREALIGVPMSTASTFAAQRRRLAQLGLSCALAERARDVDTMADARAVASHAPLTRFGMALAALEPARVAA